MTTRHRSASSHPAVALETLLAERDWLRALARSLVHDEHRAAELEQEVWLRALQRPPLQTGSLRAWMRRVLRNRWRDVQRSEAARTARQRRCAQDDARTPTSELVAQVDVQRRVAQAVLDLAEPQRTTVMLRYFEELPVREVARRMDVPYETARARLTKALATLRSALRTDDPDGSAPCWSALVALAGPAVAAPGAAAAAPPLASPTPSSPGGSAMIAKMLVPVLLSFGVGAGGGYLIKSDHSAEVAELRSEIGSLREAHESERRAFQESQDQMKMQLHVQHKEAQDRVAEQIAKRHAQEQEEVKRRALEMAQHLFPDDVQKQHEFLQHLRLGGEHR